MTIILSLTFILIKHPLSIGLILLIQSILVAIITGLYNYNYWYSYIIFLIIVGGMLVLFIYITRIASNEKFKYSNKIISLLIFTLLIRIIIYVIVDKFIIYQDIITLEINSSNQSINWINSMSKYLNYPTNLIIIIIIIHLFITLIATVKITDISYGPLRQKF